MGGEYQIAITRWENVKYEGQKKFTVYKVLVQFGTSKKWLICRRYNEFLDLHDSLVRDAEFSPLPKMPPKKAVGNRKTNFIEKRREKLETYLKTLLQTHPRIVHNTSFKQFIDYISPMHMLNTGAFASLGEKLILHIFNFLRPKDLLSLAQVCAYFNRLIEDDSLWEPKATEEFNCSSWLEVETWKEQYRYYVENPPITLNPIGSGGSSSLQPSNSSTPGGGGGGTGPQETSWTTLYNFSHHPKEVKKRLEVLAELLTTEKDYVNDLDITINVFLFPLRARQILPDNILHQIFSNIEIIVNTNRELLTKLEERMGNLEEDCNIGDIFSKMAPFFKSYNVYCGQQSTALETFNRIKKENIKEFEQSLAICESDTRCKGLNLFGFLIKPVQRICKYPLLFRELLKNTPPEHSDYVGLVDASEKIESVVEYVNEKKRFIEGLQKMIDIQHTILGVSELLQPTRKFVREGVLALLKGTSISQIHVFLFNDLVLLAKTVPHVGGLINRNVTYSAKGQVPLDVGRLITLADTDEVKYAFELSLGKKKFTLCCSGDEEKNDWVMAIRRLIKEFQRRKYSSHSMVQIPTSGSSSPSGSGSTILSSSSGSSSSSNIFSTSSTSLLISSATSSIFSSGSLSPKRLFGSKET